MRLRYALCLAVLAAALGVVRTIAPGPTSPPLATHETETLPVPQDASPDRPEWLEMYTAILNGEPMSPNNGWFRTSTTQTRYDWTAVRSRYDHDGDARIPRAEFPGDEESFLRLDRDHDGALTEADFDFTKPYASTLGSLLFSHLDRDSDGKVVAQEVEALFKAADAEGTGFLSQMDLEQALRVAEDSMNPDDPPTQEQLIQSLFSQELGSLQRGPDLGAIAPDFTLKTADGRDELTLSQIIGPKPVVLIFGNLTCATFRSMAGNLEKLHLRHGDRATFVMVYVREAHPSDGWRLKSNDLAGVSTSQPKTYEERADVAARCGRFLHLGFPVLVDDVDDVVGVGYSGMPSRFYMIDKAGRIAFKNGRGPFGFKPEELEQSLILLLQDDAR